MTSDADVPSLKPSRRGLAPQRLDWTEREHHLAGPLGAAFLDVMGEKGWLRRMSASRAIELTPKGRLEMKRRLSLDANPGACPEVPE